VLGFVGVVLQLLFFYRVGSGVSAAEEILRVGCYVFSSFSFFA